MKLRTEAVIALAVLAVAGSMAACGRSDAGGSTSTGSAARAGAPATTAGFDGKTIKVGIITAQSGPVAVIGNPVTNGNLAYFDHVNASGGIGGKYRIEPVIVDSALNPTQAVQQYNAIKGRVVMIAQLLGTVVTSAVLDQLKRDDVVAVPGSLDSLWVHEPNLIPFGAPYQIEAINGLNWYRHNGGTGERICTVAQNDLYGQAAEAGAAFAAKQDGFPLVKQVRFDPTTTDFTAPEQQLKEAGCQGVLLASTPRGTSGLLGKAASVGYAPQWIGLTSTWTAALAQSPLKDYLVKQFVLVGDGTSWGDTSVPGMAQLLADLHKYEPKQAPDPYFVLGYNQAQAAVQVLEQAVKRGDLSRAGMITAVNSLPALAFDGLMGDYVYGAADKRNPPRVNTIFAVDPSAPTGTSVRDKSVQSPAASQFQFSK